MKTVITKKTKGLILTMGLGMLSFAGFSQEHITMSLENITATSNTIDYDVYVINDGSTTLKLSACAFGANYSGVILNGGTLSTNSFSMSEGSRAQSLNGLTPSVMLNTNRDNYNQMRLTMKPTTRNSSPELLANVPYKVGHFRLTNSKPWATNSNPAITLNEFNVPGISTTCATAYIDGATNPTGFSTAQKNLSVKVANSPVLNPNHGASDISIADGSIRVDAQQSTPEVSKTIASSTTSTAIKMYPNPTQDILNVEVNATSVTNTVVKVSDIRGRIVKQIQARSEKGLNTMTVSLHEVTNGIYTVQVYQDNKLSFTDQITKKD